MPSKIVFKIYNPVAWIWPQNINGVALLLSEGAALSDCLIHFSSIVLACNGVNGPSFLPLDLMIDGS